MKRLISIFLLMIFLPMLASFSINETSSPSGSMVAYAGRTMIGGYACTCGCPSCICDTGETALECGDANRAVSSKSNTPSSDGSIDIGSTMLLVALALYFAYRIR